MPMFKPRPMAPSIFKVSSTVCNLCESDISLLTVEERKQHLVDAHGYQRVGETVFKRQVCRYCGKPGLRKVGSNYYCKDHMQHGVERRKVVEVTVHSPRSSDRNQTLDLVDHVTRKRQSLAAVKRTRKEKKVG